MPETTTDSTMARCWTILREEAERHQVPLPTIVAHFGGKQVDTARKCVMRRFYDELKLKRHEIAYLFGRDLRRVRMSEIGGGLGFMPRSKRGGAGWWRCPPRRVPTVHIGNQAVWKFAVTHQQPISRPPMHRYMRAIPSTVRETMLPSERVRLINFYESQARALAAV